MTPLERLRQEIRELLATRSEHQSNLDAVLASAEERGDGALTDDETATFNEHRSAIVDIDDNRLPPLNERLAEMEDVEARRQAQDDLARRVQAEPTPPADRPVRVTRDEPVYRQDRPESFFADAYAVRFGTGGDAGSEDRIRRHRQASAAESRSVGTSAFGALVVPNYLPEMFAEVLRAGRVTANLASGHDLPPQGMTVEIPRGTTGTAVLQQTSQNTPVAEQDFDETTLSVAVNTYAGMQKLSRQAVERGYNIDSIIYADLAGAYAAKVDADVIAGPGTSGRHYGILSSTGVLTVTYTATAPTVAGLTSKLADAIQQVNSTRFLPPDVIVMHPRRWGWFTAASDSQGRPLVVPAVNAPQNAQGVGDPAAYGFVGRILGLDVYTDANIPTTLSTSTTAGSTEDRIIVARRADLHLWENGPAPRSFRFDEPGGESLQTLLVAFNYSAFTAGHHPEGFRVVVGTGLTTPTF